MVIRDRIFSTITQVFKRHGAVTIDTFVTLAYKFSFTEMFQVPSSSLKKFCPANTVKTANLFMTSPIKVENYAPFATTSQYPSHDGSL